MTKPSDLQEALAHVLLTELARRGTDDDEVFIQGVMQRTTRNQQQAHSMRTDLRWALFDVTTTSCFIAIGFVIAASIPAGRLWLAAGLGLTGCYHLLAPTLRRYRRQTVDDVSPQIRRLAQYRLVLDQGLAIALTTIAVIILRGY